MHMHGAVVVAGGLVSRLLFVLSSAHMVCGSKAGLAALLEIHENLASCTLPSPWHGQGGVSPRSTNALHCQQCIAKLGLQLGMLLAAHAQSFSTLRSNQCTLPFAAVQPRSVWAWCPPRYWPPSWQRWE